MMVLFGKGVPGEAPAPHSKGFGATCSLGANLLPQKGQLLGVRWEKKARALASTAEFLAQKEIRTTPSKKICK